MVGIVPSKSSITGSWSLKFEVIAVLTAPPQRGDGGAGVTRGESVGAGVGVGVGTAVGLAEGSVVGIGVALGSGLGLAVLGM